MELLTSVTESIRFINLAYVYDRAFFWAQKIWASVNSALAEGTPFYVAHVLSALFAVGIIYCLVRTFFIYRGWNNKYGVEHEEHAEEHVTVNPRWERVVALRDSANPSDWKLAILEADEMLNEIVERLGYKGENLGERMKTIEPSDFPMLQDAWEAHKVRNQIAHEGAAFDLPEREAIRVIKLYENVFKDSHYI